MSLVSYYRQSRVVYIFHFPIAIFLDQPSARNLRQTFAIAAPGLLMAPTPRAEMTIVL